LGDSSQEMLFKINSTFPHFTVERLKMSTIKEYQNEILEWGKTMGWNDDRTFSDHIALMHTELSEAFEEYRNGHALTEVYYSEGDNNFPKPEGVPIELADVVIRILHFCAHQGIDLDTMLRIKQEYNHKRKFRHGGKRL
jgi:hypothetical protein